MFQFDTLAQKVRYAVRALRKAEPYLRVQFLNILAHKIEEQQEEILGANGLDISQARSSGLSPHLVDRLTLSSKILQDMAADVRKIALLPDPLGRVIENKILENGLKVQRITVPLGTVASVYEARPNVTVDIAALAIRAGNAVILRGGKEALNSNLCLANLIKKSLLEASLPEETLSFIENTDRGILEELLRRDDFIDVLIPRGSQSLQDFCKQKSSIPLLTGGVGVVHLYVSEYVDESQAFPIIMNAKVQRPSVCNALDCLLVHEKRAVSFLPLLAKQLEQAQVEIRGCKETLEVLKNYPMLLAAETKDYGCEYLSLKLAVRVVKSMDEALEHIDCYSSKHSDGILTTSQVEAQRFFKEIDSACVYWNASTRFTDGGQLGLGAEVAISTQKLHARGPVGLEALTSYKWIIEGSGHIRPL